MEKAEDKIPMFARFVERGLALPACDFFKGLLGYYRVEYLNLNPNGIFHTAVFVHFCEAFLGIRPHWILFRKFFRVKPQPSATNPRVVGGASIQLTEDSAEQYLAYKLVDSNTDWKTRWFYITNHHPGLPKPSGRQPRHREWWNTEPTMQEGIQLLELLARIKVLREAGLRAEHMAFSFMKRRVQPLMARAPWASSTPATTTRRGCPEASWMTATSSRGCRGSSKICRCTRRALSKSTPPRARPRR
jgi:hypothetical protein